MKVVIDVEEYKDLLEADLLLSYLRSYGVDNWDGYDDAHSEFYEELKDGYVDKIVEDTEKSLE